MSKKALVIIAIIIVVVAIVVGVYFGLLKSKTYLTPIPGGSLPIASPGSSAGVGTTGQNQNTQGNAPGITGGSEGDEGMQAQLNKLTQLSTASVAGYWVASSTVLSLQMDPSFPNPIFYVTSQGDVVLLTGQNKEQKITSSQYGVPIAVTGNTLGTKALVTFDSGTIALFDAVQKVWIPLNGAVSAAFSPDGTQVAYLADAGSGTVSLYTQNVSSSRRPLVRIVTLHMSDTIIAWPLAHAIVLLPRQSSLYNAQAWTVNLSQKTVQSFVSGRGLGTVFPENGSVFVYFVSKDSAHMLGFIADAATGNIASPLPFSTLSQKCGFNASGSYLFCGIPLQFTQAFNATLPDSYLEHAIFSNDSLYRIGIANMSVDQILNGSTLSLDIAQVEATDNTVFFVDHRTQHLYSFAL